MFRPELADVFLQPGSLLSAGMVSWRDSSQCPAEIPASATIVEHIYKAKLAQRQLGLNILLRHSSLKSDIKGRKEFGFGDMDYGPSDRMAFFSPFSAAQSTRHPTAEAIGKSESGIQSVMMLFSSQYISKSAE